MGKTNGAAPAPTKERLRIEYVELSELRRWPRNPKKHDLGFLGEAFSENGFVEPIVVDEGTGKIVAGHGRLDKLQELRDAGGPPPDRVDVRAGKWFAPVVRGATLRNPAKHVLASNRGPELGGWDGKMLADHLGKLGDGNLVGTGFSQADFAKFMSLEDGTFLDKFKGGAAGDGATRDRSPDGFFTFALKLTPDQDRRVQAGVKAAKAKFGVRTSLDAVLAMCDNLVDAAQHEGDDGDPGPEARGRDQRS